MNTPTFPDLFEKAIAQGQVNARDAQGHTALHVAVFVDQPEWAKRLLAAGAEVDARTVRAQETPLHWVKSPEMAKVLLAHGADPNALNAYQQTVLHNLKHKPLKGRDVQQVLVEGGFTAFDHKDHGGIRPVVCEEIRQVVAYRKHLEASLAQIPSPAHVNGAVAQSQGPSPERPKRRL